MSLDFFKAALLLIAEIILIVLLFPGDWATASVEKEMAAIEEFLGEEAYTDIDKRATGWHYEVFIESGFENGLYNMFLPTEEQIENSRGMERVGETWFAFLEGRIQVLLTILYQTMLRLSMAATWAPYFLCLIIPSVFDGFMSRLIKINNFDYPSPMLHRYSLKAITVTCVGMPMIFMLPIPIPPWFVPTALLIASACSGVAVANFYKKV